MSKIKVKDFLKKLDFKIINRVPIIHQTESSECGLACLTMICSFYGKNIDLSAVRQQFNLSSRGTSLYSLTGIAEQLGMNARPLSLNLNELNALKKPCILHWDFSHFVVLVQVKSAGIIIHDPAQGRRTVSFSEASRYFTGVALELWPDSKFNTDPVRKRLKLGSLIKGIYGIKKALCKILLLSFVIEAINLISPIGTQLVMDHAIPAGDIDLLSLVCIALFISILLRAVIDIVRSWSSLVMTTLINVQWQSGLFNHLLSLPLEYFERRKLGDIQSRFNSLDVLRDTFTSSVVGAIMDSIMVVGVSIMMVVYGGWLTWVVLIFTALYVLLRLFTYKYYRQLSEESMVKSSRAASYFMETLYGIAAIKVQGMAKRRSAHWVNLEIDNINTSINMHKMEILFIGINTFVAACDQILILWLGISLIIHNQMTIGMFVAFNTFRGQFSDRIGSLTNFLLQLRMTSLHNERIADIALHAQENHKPESFFEKKITPISLKTTLLTYQYDSQSPAVFANLSINISPGESVALVGSSGSGKTTLMKVLCGLFLPTSGKVEVNGIDIQKIGINNYHKMIGCVMQDDKLFSGTIKENICGFEEDVDLDWMYECSRNSYLHDVIMALPMGYDTLIGELGEGLSGGQRQRLFIARAIYKRPGLLFMDEATSALDQESEKIVNCAIKNLSITRVIIAHRETTISSADRVISLEKIKIE